MRMAHRLAVLVLLCSVAYTVHAQDIGQVGPQVSPEFWLGVGFSVISALIAGYTKGIQRRVEKNEEQIRALHQEDRQLQAQISMVRESLPQRFHDKAEVERHYDELKDMIRALHGRLDQFAIAAAGRGRNEDPR